MAGDPRETRGAGRYSVTVQRSFSAVHRLRLADGSLEPQHGHDWLVQAAFDAVALDSTGMVVDFHHAEATLAALLAPWHHADLNQYIGFAGLNPTAEVVARHVYDGLASAGLAVCRVSVTEAPGCVATYERIDT